MATLNGMVKRGLIEKLTPEQNPTEMELPLRTSGEEGSGQRESQCEDPEGGRAWHVHGVVRRPEGGHRVSKRQRGGEAGMWRGWVSLGEMGPGASWPL